MVDKDQRTRVWSVVLYPESAGEGWRDKLEKTAIPIAISPLHDRDQFTDQDEKENPEHKAGSLKKPHYHIVLYYNGVKSRSQVEKDIEGIGALSYPHPVSDTKGFNRYLAHLDQPTKAQYDPKDIVLLNGANCDLSKPISPDQLDVMIGEITDFIRDNHITEYCDLVFYCRDNNQDWFSVVRKQTVYFKGVIASYRHKTTLNAK